MNIDILYKTVCNKELVIKSSFIPYPLSYFFTPKDIYYLEPIYDELVVIRYYNTLVYLYKDNDGNVFVKQINLLVSRKDESILDVNNTFVMCKSGLSAIIHIIEVPLLEEYDHELKKIYIHHTFNFLCNLSSTIIYVETDKDKENNNHLSQYILNNKHLLFTNYIY